MGQVCSSCCGNGTPVQGQAESAIKEAKHAPISTVPKAVAAQVSPPAPDHGQPAGPAAPPQAAVLELRTLVQQAVHASRGDVVRAEQQQPQGAAVLAGGREDFSSSSSSTGGEDVERWHDALDELQLEEVLTKWDEDQTATLQRLDRALQMLQAKGLAELAGPRPAQLPRPEVLAAAAASAPASQQQQQQQQPAVQYQTSLEKAKHRLAAIFDSVHAPHGLEAEALVAEVQGAVEDHRVFAAERTLRTLCTRVGCSKLSDLAQHEDLLGVDVRAVEQEAAEVRALLADLTDDDGWMLSRDDEMRVLYKHEKGGTAHGLKFSMTLEHPAEHILALGNEFDLIKTWNKFSTDSEKIWQKDIFECVLYGAQWMPRPFKQFYALLTAKGVDLADEESQSLLIVMKDVSPASLPPEAAPLPAATAKRRICNVLSGCINIRPLPAGPGGKPRTFCQLMVHIDPHIPMVPAFLMNFVLGVLAPYIFSQIKQILAKCFDDPEGVYPKRIAANPELYGRFRQRLAQFDSQLGLGYGMGSSGSSNSREVAGGVSDSDGKVVGSKLVGSQGKDGSGLITAGQQQSDRNLQQQRQQQQQAQSPARQLGILDTFDNYTFHDAYEHHHEQEPAGGSP